MPHPSLTFLLASLIAPALMAAGGPLLVTEVTPDRHDTYAPTNTVITARFTEALDPTTVDGSVCVFGRWSGVAMGTVTLEEGGLVLKWLPDRPFFPGEWVTVGFNASIASLSGELLFGGHSFAFWARGAAGPGTFSLTDTLSTRVRGEGLVQSYGIYAGDLDRDGAPDFSIPTEEGDDVRVMMNDGCLGFSEPVPHPIPGNPTPSSNEGADFNGDGILDIATANIIGDSMSVFFGDGAGGYGGLTTYPSGDSARGLGVLDVEGDGDTDIIVAHRGGNDLALFRNDGSGSFAPGVHFEGGGTAETAVSPADGNNDGYLDIFVAHYLADRVTLLTNDGLGNFTVSASAAVGSRPWMTAVGDVDRDGAVDVATCNSISANASIVRGDGAGGLFPAINVPTGPFPIAVDLGDIDGDADLDLVVSSITNAEWNCWLNDGAGNFTTSFDLPSILAGSCAVLLDVNRDGLVDIVGIDEFSDTIRLWTQDEFALPVMQDASCTATLRLDEMAVHAGFGGNPLHEIHLGERMFLGVTSTPFNLWALTTGVAHVPALQTPWGLLSIQAPLTLALIWNTDGNGESQLALDIPLGLPALGIATLRVFVATPAGLRVSNAEGIILVP